MSLIGVFSSEDSEKSSKKSGLLDFSLLELALLDGPKYTSKISPISNASSDFCDVCDVCDDKDCSLELLSNTNSSPYPVG